MMDNPEGHKESSVVEAETKVEQAPANPVEKSIEKPDEARKKKPMALFVALILFGVALVVGGIVALVMLLSPKSEPETPEPTLEEEIRETYGEEAKPISSDDFLSIDIANDDIPYYEVENRFNAMMSAANIYKDCYDTACYIRNLDAFVKNNNITDKNKLLLIDLEKAKLYSIAKMPDEAWNILEKIKEEELLKNQKHPYYVAMATYYGNIGQAQLESEYLEKVRETAMEDRG